MSELDEMHLAAAAAVGVEGAVVPVAGPPAAEDDPEHAAQVAERKTAELRRIRGILSEILPENQDIEEIAARRNIDPKKRLKLLL